MVFSSAPFLFIFLPVILIVYTCIRNLKAQNVLLIIASLFFYAYGAPYFVIVMVVFVFINYLLARLIAGPIVKYHDVYTYINSRRQTPDEVAKGIRRFILGLGKKLLLADTVALAADAIFELDAGSLSFPMYWLSCCFCSAS